MGGRDGALQIQRATSGCMLDAFSLLFFSIVLKTSWIDSSSDFGPVLGPKLEAFSYSSLS